MIDESGPYSVYFVSLPSGLGDTYHVKSSDQLEPTGYLESPERLELEAVDIIVDFLLSKEPSPYIMAFAEDGSTVPVPADVPAAPGHAITGPATALEMCLPADLPTLIDAWHRVLVKRAAYATIRLRHAPESPVLLHFVDARHRYGVYLALLIGSGGIETSGPPSDLFRRRACSMERDARAFIVDVDAAFTEVLGWSREEILGKQTMDIIHPEDKALGIARWMEMLHRPGSDQRVMLRLIHRDGDHRWFEVTNRNLLGIPGCGRVLTDLFDVSDRMAAVEALRASEELLQRLAQALPLGIMQIDADRHIVYRNDALSEILGVTDARNVDRQFALISASDRPAFVVALDDVLTHGTAAEVELTIDVPSGTRRCSIAVRALRAVDATIIGAILCVNDVTERVRLYAEVERRAKFDELTRCYNRASIFDKLEATLSAVEQHTRGVAVVFIDLDRFKDVNDHHGHAAGDRVLQLSAARIIANVRDVDFVGRIGGDEFLVVCPDITADVALQIARRLTTVLAAPISVGATAVATSSSVGVTWTHVAGECDALVAKADEAMYAAKRSGAGPVLST